MRSVYLLSFDHLIYYFFFFFFSSRRRHTRYIGDWSSDVCSSDLRKLTSHLLSPYEQRFTERVPLTNAAERERTNRFHDDCRSEERRVGKECRCRWSRYR